MKRSIWFPEEEYSNRISKAKSLMKESGIDCLLITGNRNYVYLSGHRPIAPGFAPTRPNLFFLPREGDAILLVHTFVRDDAKATSWIEDIREYRILNASPLDETIRILKTLDLPDRRIGVELGQEQRIDMPVGDFDELRKKLPEFEFVDAGGLLWKLRMTKSPREIAHIREACAITARAYDRGFPMVKAGMTENEVGRLFSRLMIEEGADTSWILITSGAGNYDRISGYPTNRRIEQGDMLWIDMGAGYLDYWTDYSRAAVLGGPSAQQMELQNLVHEVTMEGIRIIRPGLKGKVIVDVCQKAMKERGLNITFEAGRVGHGVGLLILELPHIARYDETVLEEGMVITVEPGMVTDSGVFHVEENVLVTATGHEILSGSQRELWKI